MHPRTHLGIWTFGRPLHGVWRQSSPFGTSPRRPCKGVRTGSLRSVTRTNTQVGRVSIAYSQIDRLANDGHARAHTHSSRSVTRILKRTSEHTQTRVHTRTRSRTQVRTRARPLKAAARAHTQSQSDPHTGSYTHKPASRRTFTVTNAQAHKRRLAVRAVVGFRSCFFVCV